MLRYCSVMEMTFPHQCSRPADAAGRGHQALLAIAIARQAGSRTARLISPIGQGTYSESFGDEISRRIHYFGSHPDNTNRPFGPFWSARRTSETVQAKHKSDVYQYASRNSKTRPAIDEATGDQFNHAGHGALRTL
jgi:hypothetical protein